MDKNNFISLLNRYSRCTVSEALDILALKQKYPYSQVLHALAAKVSKDHGFSTQQQELQQAAVYAADRAVLKEIISSVSPVSEDQSTAKKTVDDKPVNTGHKVDIQVPEHPAVRDSLNTVDLAEIVIKDLKQLNKARHNFESMFEGSAENPLTEKPGTDTDSDIDTEADKDKSLKTKKERIIELARAKAQESSVPAKTEKAGGTKKRLHQTDGLINEIVSSKKEINPETEKQKKQIQMIDEFIRAQPTISNSKDKPPFVSHTDLSTIKSGEFGDNIVSETLVNILLKQGKKDKAIEVLKKLIWKFPQKKAYFAAQIEELKK